MKQVGLAERQIELFMRRLQAGWVWSNGLVGEEVYSFEDGEFVVRCRDMRERDLPPIVQRYDEEALRERLRRRRWPEFVTKGLGEVLAS
ncbi:MAG TPA: hypothetical protein VLL52_16905 [Anaerolineae bacterium]|nr:hypothetical protein [Anaerolineae bacterium]